MICFRSLFVVSRRTLVSGKCPREKWPGGNVRSPVYWCGLNRNRRRSSSCITSTGLRRSSASRLNAQCMRQITRGHLRCHCSVYRIRLSVHVSIKLYVDLYLTFCEIRKSFANFCYSECIWRLRSRRSHYYISSRLFNSTKQTHRLLVCSVIV